MRVFEHSLHVVLLVHQNLVFAFSRLTSRGGCDSFVCGPSVTDLIDGAEAIGNGGGALVDAGIGATAALFGWTVNKISGLLEPPKTGSPTSNVDEIPKDDAPPNTGATAGVDNDRTDMFNPFIAPDAGIATPKVDDAIPKVDDAIANGFNPTPAPVPDIETDAIKTPLRTSDCDSPTAPPPLPDLNSDQGFVNLGITHVQGCEKATAQIVWSANCQDTESNEVTENILRGMDPGVFASAAAMCAVKGGTSFWALQLTQDQIEELTTKYKQSIKAVEPNAHIEPAGVLSTHLSKRDFVIKQEEEILRLRFISSKNKRKPNQNAESYAYFTPAGAKTFVYLIDTGLNEFNAEFRPSLVEKLYALGTDPKISDPDMEFHGSCMASLITGQRFGVSKNAELILVKVVQRVASFLNGLSKIVDHVRQQVEAKKTVRGYTVVNISWGFTEDDCSILCREEMEQYIKELAETYQIVVVVSAGQDFNSGVMYPSVYKWPAILSLTTDIITVGAVQVTNGEDNGKRYEWSPGGEALTVNAPGEADCATALPGRVFGVGVGTSGAAATVTGLVAYFMSLPVGDHLRGFDNFPMAMINYIMLQSYPRFGTDEAISNGLDGDSNKRKWTHWLGNPGDF